MQEDRRLPILLRFLALGLYALYFGLNFLGSAALAPLYVLIAVITSFVTLVYPIKISLFFIFPLSFIEGQGRILFGYHPLARILFDLILTIAVIKSVAKNRRFIQFERIPQPLTVFIILHLLWFLFELVNPNGAGVLASFATSKAYVFPLLLFFTLSDHYYDFTKRDGKNLVKLMLLLLFGESLLAVYQKFQGSDLMYSITPYYLTLKPNFAKFTGGAFRPWGTTHYPGAAGVWIAYTTPFILLYQSEKSVPMKSILKWIFGIFLVGLTWLALFFCDSRALWLKNILCLVGGGSILIYGSKHRIRRMSEVLIGSGIFFSIVALSTSYLDELDEAVSIGKNIQRIQQITTVEGFTSQRQSPLDTLRRVTSETDWPLGWGLGMTTNMLSAFEERRKQLDDVSSDVFWSGDSLLGALILELGIGSFFYISIVVLNLVFLWSMCLRLYLWKQDTQFHQVGVMATMVTVITIGNYASGGLLYNPESFFYWFFSAMSYANYYVGKQKFLEEKPTSEPTEATTAQVV